MTNLDMEVVAARAAIANAGIDPSEIGLLLSHTVVPDVLLSNPACPLHAKLGLPRECITLSVEGAAYSFILQLELARALISTRRARYGLLVQSFLGTRLVERDDPLSVLFGDGASAVVVGPVSSGRGILGSAHFTDGRFATSLVLSPVNRRIVDDGRAIIHIPDPAQMRDVFLQTADLCKEGVDAVLASTSLDRSDVDFICVNGTPWLREVVHGFLELPRARSYEIYQTVGYLSSAMIPINLELARQAGELRTGDRVMLTGGGTGMTFGATMMTWEFRS